MYFTFQYHSMHTVSDHCSKNIQQVVEYAQHRYIHRRHVAPAPDCDIHRLIIVANLGTTVSLQNLDYTVPHTEACSAMLLNWTPHHYSIRNNVQIQYFIVCLNANIASFRIRHHFIYFIDVPVSFDECSRPSVDSLQPLLACAAVEFSPPPACAIDRPPSASHCTRFSCARILLQAWEYSSCVSGWRCPTAPDAIHRLQWALTSIDEFARVL